MRIFKYLEKIAVYGIWFGGITLFFFVPLGFHHDLRLGHYPRFRMSDLTTKSQNTRATLRRLWSTPLADGSIPFVRMQQLWEMMQKDEEEIVKKWRQKDGGKKMGIQIPCLIFSPPFF